MESKGFSVAVFNRTVSKVDNFVNGRGKDKNIIGCHSIEELCANLETPRKVMLMVKSGKPVDDFIELVIPHLEAGDIVIDGATVIFLIPSAAPLTSKVKVCNTLAPESPAARKALCSVLQLCPAVLPAHGPT